MPARNSKGTWLEEMKEPALTVSPVQPLTRKPLARFLPSASRSIEVRLVAIQLEVSKAFGLDVADLHQGCRRHNIAWPRQVCMYLMYELTPLDFPEIGAWFKKDRGTARQGIEHVHSLLQAYPQLGSEIGAIRTTLEKRFAKL